MTGTVKWFNNAKGYGFIKAEANMEEVFFHHTSIDVRGFRTLTEGAAVTFDLYDTEKGWVAHNIKLQER